MKKYLGLGLISLLMSGCTIQNNPSSPSSSITSEVTGGLSNLVQLAGLTRDLNAGASGVCPANSNGTFSCTSTDGSTTISSTVVSFPDLTPENQLETQVVNLAYSPSDSNAGPLEFSIDVTNTDPFFILFNHCAADSQIAGAFVLNPGQSCQVMIGINGRGLYNTIPGSPYTSGVSVTNAAQSPASSLVQISLQVNVSGNPNPALEGSASLIMTLNAPFSSTSVYQVLTVANVGSGTANIGSITMPTDFSLLLNHCPPTLTPGNSCEMFVLYNGFRTGVDPSTLTSAEPISIAYSDATYNSTAPTGPATATVDVLTGLNGSYTGSGGTQTPILHPTSISMSSDSKLIYMIDTNSSSSPLTNLVAVSLLINGQDPNPNKMNFIVLTGDVCNGLENMAQVNSQTNTVATFLASSDGTSSSLQVADNDLEAAADCPTRGRVYETVVVSTLATQSVTLSSNQFVLRLE